MRKSLVGKNEVLMQLSCVNNVKGFYFGIANIFFFNNTKTIKIINLKTYGKL